MVNFVNAEKFCDFIRNNNIITVCICVYSLLDQVDNEYDTIVSVFIKIPRITIYTEYLTSDPVQETRCAYHQ